MDSIPQKRCCRCGEEKPATSEFFRQTKRRPDGFHGACKLCTKELELEGRRKRGIKPKAYVNEQGERQCTECGIWKTANTDFFYMDGDKLASKCKECRKNSAKDWRIKNLDYSRLVGTIRYQLNRDEILAYKKKWNLDHPEYMREYRINHVETIRVQNQEWRKRNPDKVKFSLQRRYSRRKGLPGTFTEAEWQVALEYFNHRCAVCERPIGLWHTLVPDHWIPLDYDGDDNPGGVAHNLVPMCHGSGGCNNSKSNKMPHDWLRQKYNKRKSIEIIGQIEAYFEAVKNGSLRDQYVQAAKRMAKSDGRRPV